MSENETGRLASVTSEIASYEQELEGIKSRLKGDKYWPKEGTDVIASVGEIVQSVPKEIKQGKDSSVNIEDARSGLAREQRLAQKDEFQEGLSKQKMDQDRRDRVNEQLKKLYQEQEELQNKKELSEVYSKLNERGKDNSRFDNALRELNTKKGEISQEVYKQAEKEIREAAREAAELGIKEIISGLDQEQSGQDRFSIDSLIQEKIDYHGEDSLYKREILSMKSQVERAVKELAEAYADRADQYTNETDWESNTPNEFVRERARKILEKKASREKTANLENVRKDIVEVIKGGNFNLNEISTQSVQEFLKSRASQLGLEWYELNVISSEVKAILKNAKEMESAQETMSKAKDAQSLVEGLGSDIIPEGLRSQLMEKINRLNNMRTFERFKNIAKIAGGGIAVGGVLSMLPIGALLGVLNTKGGLVAGIGSIVGLGPTIFKMIREGNKRAAEVTEKLELYRDEFQELALENMNKYFDKSELQSMFNLDGSSRRSMVTKLTDMTNELERSFQYV